LKKPIKSLLGRAIFESGLSATLVGDAAVVVAFHRIQDTPDPCGLTTSVGMFERHCRFFMRHFQVISLRELVDRLERGATVHRTLAITFDDGYRDNFENAAPVLEELGLPATFFVVSRWMGTDVVPWWDRQQGVVHSWMTWDHVRSLRQRGFDIGAHTQTHADLGQIAGPDARDEILGSKAELERQLEAPIDLFAYPYGGWANLTEANREQVQAAGFRCCCSAVGGLNGAGTDPFHLRRIPISPWYTSPQQFGLEVALGMSAVAR
jgi:peptidoglycan/xylan/chitin deacetylase (PgdA/CDA1 family)